MIERADDAKIGTEVPYRKYFDAISSIFARLLEFYYISVSIDGFWRALLSYWVSEYPDLCWAIDFWRLFLLIYHSKSG